MTDIYFSPVHSKPVPSGLTNPLFLCGMGLIFLSVILTLISTASASVTPQVAGGDSHSLALKSDGTVWACGNNTHGQLGDGTTTGRKTPVQVSNISGVTAIACGWNHSLALKSDGTVWAWGNNTYGQLGDGTTTKKNTPIQVNGISNIIVIGCGGSHSLAVKSDGTVWTWGNNTYGQLGDGTTTNRSTPIQVSELSDATKVTGGGYYSLALLSDSTVYAWGRNNNGELGTGTGSEYITPVQVSGLTDITSITGGHNEYGHSLALKSDGTIWAWGHNWWGALGDGTVKDSFTPIQVNDLSGIIAIACGWEHSMAIQSDGSVWCWGNNDSGQLGDGTVETKYSPVQLSINLGQAATPTPTASITPSPSPTPTATPTPSPIPEGNASVFGFVYDPDANALRGVTVTITGNGSSDSAETDKEGYYEFLNLAAEDYTLTFEKEGYQTQSKDISIEESEELEVETVTLEEIEKGTIYGYVVDIEGEPIEFVRLKLRGFKTGITKTESSDKDGFFEFTDLEAGTYFITTKRKGYRKGKITVKLEDGESTEVEIELRKTSRRDIIAIGH